MTKLDTMNISLMDCMIRPFAHERQERKRQQDGCGTSKHELQGQRQHCLVDYSPELAGGNCAVVPSPMQMMQPLSRSGSVVPSKSIPISNIQGEEEVHLREEEAMADYRDYCFYLRLVHGMNNKSHAFYHRLRGTDQSLANIMRTRNLPLASSETCGAAQSPEALCSCYNDSASWQRRSHAGSMTLGKQAMEEDEEEIFVLEM